MPSNLQPGTILYVRVTSEPVAFIRYLEGRDDAVLVRRPLESKDGITHEVETWPLVELENFEEGLRRRWEDSKFQDALRKELETVATEAPTPDTIQ